MKKYFLDCGANVGQSVKYFINYRLIDKDTIIHIFEPNITALDECIENLKQYDDYSITYHNVAIWSKTCVRPLTVEYCGDDYKCQLNDEIISGNKEIGGATNIMCDEWKKPSYINDNQIISGRQVACIDFSQFLRYNIPDGSQVICKMDIEGAEFEVLSSLIKQKTIRKISKLYIEWHDHLLKNPPNKKNIISELKRNKIDIGDWI